MIKKILFVMVMVMVLLFSVSSIQASDVNVLNHTGEMALQIDEDAQLKIADESIIGDDLEQNNKNQTQLKSPTTKIYYNGNYQVTLMDSDANQPLPRKAVSLSINNVNYSVKTNSKGVASVNLKLNPGSYLTTASFAGDGSFNSSSISGKVKVLTTIKASDVTKYYKGSKAYKATYLDSKGNLLKYKKVAITVNGKKYTAKTNAKGVASVAVDLKPGTYKVLTTNPKTGEKRTSTFKILSTVSASNLKKVKGDSNKFVAKFLKSDGNALAKQQVRIKIGSNTYTYRTYSNGQLKLPLNDLKKGTYKVVCYNTDGLSITRTVQIFDKASTKLTTSDYTFLTNETQMVKIKFTTELDDNSKSGKAIRIFINGLPQGTKKTDSNGEINFKLPSLKPGVYYLLCEFPSSKFFKYSYVEKHITILDTTNAEFAVDGITSFGNFAGTPFGVILTVGDVPLIKSKVTFKVDGETYSGTTNDFGFVSIPINLDVGNYTVNYKFSGNSKVNAASGSSNITVFERTNVILSGNYKTSYDDTVQSFNVYLKDANGNPMVNESVDLIIDGMTYTENTDANGYALIKTAATVGKYTVLIVYNGNNYYNSSSKSGSTTVTLSKYANGINEKNGSASSSYLKETRNCQVNNAKIKSLVKSLTEGLTNDLDKAKVLFRYVQNNIGYEFYFDTNGDAVKTLDSKKGNGVDQAHLLIAMYRAAGLKARYVHGECTFYKTGETYGHVWTQVLVDNTWICGDSSDFANDFGKILNWNVDNYRLLNKYRELPF